MIALCMWDALDFGGRQIVMSSGLLVPYKSHDPAAPQKMTVFGNWIFADVTGYDEVILNLMAGILVRGMTEIFSQGRSPFEDKGGDY